jgi:TonB family protein
VAELERRRREERAARVEGARRRAMGVALCAVIAALAHAGVILPLLGAWTAPSSEARADTVVKMVSLSRDRPKLRAESARRELREREREPEPDAPRDAEQVVSLPSSTDEAPEHADYLARADHSVERETRSRMARQDFQNPSHRPTLGVDQETLEAARKAQEGADAQRASSGGGGQGAAGTGADAASGEGERVLAFEVPKIKRQEKVDLTPEAGGDVSRRPSLIELPGKGRRLRLSLGKQLDPRAVAGLGGASASGLEGRRGRGFGDLPDLAALTPSLEELQRVTGAPAPDYLPDVETDAETRLNAWRWKHAAFFDRLKRGVAREWQGRQVYNRHDPTRAVYGTQELTTVLRVRIDRAGNIVELNVAEASGADFLDDEAVRTMRATGPFPNPPAGMFTEGETFAFRFGFIITNERRHIDFNWKPY